MDTLIENLLRQMQLDNEQRRAEMQLMQLESQKKDEMMQQVLERLANQQPAPQPAENVAQGYSLVKDLSDRMENFIYDAEENATFELWYARYEAIFTEDAASLTEKAKVGLLLQKLTNQDYQKFANTILPRKPMELNLETAVNELKRMYGRKESLFSMRFKCLKIAKSENEDYKTYAARVNSMCEKFDIAKCSAEDFKVLLFVQGLNKSQDSITLEKLLAKLDAQYTDTGLDAGKKLKLQELVNIAERLNNLINDKGMVIRAEAVKSEILEIRKTEWSQNKQQNPVRQRYESKAPSCSTDQAPKFPCWLCGEIHFHRNCPFKDKECQICKIQGHKSGYCQSAARAKAKKARRGSDKRRQSFAIQGRSESTRKSVMPSINNRKITLQLDTGSDWTIISRTNWEILGMPVLVPCKEQAISATGDYLDIMGSFQAKLELYDREADGQVYVANSALNVLGSDWMELLRLFDVPLSAVCNRVHANGEPSLTEEVRVKFPSVFADDVLGLCNRMKVSLKLKPGARPVFCRQRPVPYAAAQAIQDELQRLQCLGVIQPIEYANSAAPIVAVKKKNGGTRVTADYSTGLNAALESNQYPLPTPADIWAKFAGCTIFSNIDLSDAFLQLELDDVAKKLMVINTHVGLFQVNRLQPGVKTAPGIFQQLMDTMLGGMCTVAAYLDDIIVAGKDEQDHRQKLFAVLNRIQDYGFTLKLAKCSFGQKSICYLGHIIDADGLRPDKSKVEVIQQLPVPADISMLRAFLGAINWYGKFIKGLKDLREPLDELLREDVKYEWTPARDEAFRKLKNVLATDLALAHYDPTKKIIVAADASSYGMGAVLLHKFENGSERPIMYAASSFSMTEKNYAQNQREALALVFALKKFHRYIYGRKFELRTDHQPLLAVFGSKKGVPVYSANRLQRYALVMLAYDFDIKYISTKSFAYADFISRLINAQPKPEPEDTIIATIRIDSYAECFAIDSAKSLPVNFEAIQAETAKSEVLKEVAYFIKQGWPEKKKQIRNVAVAEYFQLRTSLSLIKECIFYGERVVMPFQLHKPILEELHSGHPGTARMKLLARSKVYWPGIDNDIESHVKRCGICETNSKLPRKCTLQAWPMPKGPWSRIHIDYAGPVNGFYYLVIVDAFSNWPEVFKMSSTTSEKTVENLMETFARHGLCDIIVSDNGPQFKSDCFKRMCAENGIEHITTAPYNPQSNGRAERFVELLKTGLEKLKEEGNVDKILRKFLMCYRYTPSYALGMKSPYKLMTGHDMKTKLDLLKPPEKRSDVRNTKMEQQFNAHYGARWKEFSVGDAIYFKSMLHNGEFEWLPGKIESREGAVNYVVQIEPPNGRRVRAHSNQLKFRHANSCNDNLLMDMCEIAPLNEVVEPMIMPRQQQIGDDGELSNAINIDEAIDVGSGNEVQEVQLRRTTRATAGKMPSRFNDFDISRLNILIREECGDAK